VSGHDFSRAESLYNLNQPGRRWRTAQNIHVDDACHVCVKGLWLLQWRRSIMVKTLSFRSALVLTAVLGGVISVVPRVSFAAGISGVAGQAGQQDLAGAVKAKLNKSQFKNVQVSVDAGGIVTLTGSTDLYEYKADAAKRVQKVKGVTGVRDRIAVGGPAISDAKLQDSLVTKLSYDRVGYGNVFDAIGVKVQNGVVTLSGTAHTYPNRDSAIGLVSTTPGVKDVIDEISVDPVSPMDDRIRLQVARAVYGFPSLNRYAIDPAKPIRISVQNGNVALYGVVDSQADKNAAGIQANGVPGVFSVKNYLQVAGQPAEKQ
jgi:hyperosmotically inducible periplasmic protein